MQTGGRSELKPAIFRALCETIVPESAQLTPPSWDEMEGIIARALATRPAAMKRQLNLFIGALQWLAFFRHGKTFTSLEPDRRARFLSKIQDSRLLLFRRGFWGLRTLILMGFYGRPEAISEIGYRADARGWSARAC